MDTHKFNYIRLIEQNALPENNVHVVAIEGAHHNLVDQFCQYANYLIDFIHEKLNIENGCP